MSFAIALTDQEAIDFFKNTLGMASNTRLALVAQEITRPEHLTELEEEDIKTLAETLRRSVGAVPDLTNRRRTVPAPAYPFSIIS